jgi:hypothetical protein
MPVATHRSTLRHNDKEMFVSPYFLFLHHRTEAKFNSMFQAASTTQADSLCDQEASHIISRNEVVTINLANSLNQLQKFRLLMPKRLIMDTEFTTVALIPAAIGTDKALYEPKQRQKPPRNSKF